MRIPTAALLLILAGCGETPHQTPTPAPDKTPEAYRLPVSLNEVMVALVNDAANPIWMAAWRSPTSERGWRELERRAYQLHLAGSLIASPGTGALDDKWAAKPAWLHWSGELRATGAAAVAAAEQRNAAAIATIGDRLVEVCEGCHTDFKLPYPTGGKFGELAPAPSEVE